MTNDKKPYGPEQYKRLVKENYFITKNLNTTYNDVCDMTIIERDTLLSLIMEDNRRSKEMLDKAKQESQAKSKKRR